jgi:hypothetical protein
VGTGGSFNWCITTPTALSSRGSSRLGRRVVSGAADDSSGHGASVFSVAHYGNAVHQYMDYTCRELVWILKRRVVRDFRGIKYGHVCVHALLKQPPILYRKPPRHRRRHLPNGVLDRDHTLFPHVLSKDTRVVPV